MTPRQLNNLIGGASRHGEPVTLSVVQVHALARYELIDKQAAVNAAKSAELPDDYIWSESNQEKFKFGAKRAADKILKL